MISAIERLRSMSMNEFERARLEFIKSLMDFDRAAEASPRAERVLPADVDLDAELSRLFADHLK